MLSSLIFTFTCLLLTINCQYIVEISSKDISSFYSKYQSKLKKKLDTYPELLQIGTSFYGVIDDLETAFLKSLVSNQEVLDISLDSPLSITDIQEFAPRHLVRISQREKLKPNQPMDYVYDPTAGSGVDIYVLDSGISSHPDLGSRLHRGNDYVHLEDDSKIHPHGTSVAGLCCSETYGIAKKANIIDYRVCDENGATKLSYVLWAISDVIQEARASKRPSLILLALGMKRNPLLNHAVEAAIQQGIPVITGAGNQRKAACKTSPASAKGVLTVGSIDARNDQLAPFTNFGSCVDLFAPGVEVVTLDHQENGGVPKSGTSMSAALTAGLVGYFMGMGDTGSQAVARVKNYTTTRTIPERELYFRPYTPNNILFNCNGAPLW